MPYCLEWTPNTRSRFRFFPCLWLHNLSEEFHTNYGFQHQWLRRFDQQFPDCVVSLPSVVTNSSKPLWFQTQQFLKGFNMTPTALIYTRYSPRPSKDGDAERAAANEDAESIQLQVEVCQRYALMKGLLVSETIKDPETSARKTPLFEREGGWRLKHLPKGTHIIAMKLARLFRSAVDGLQTLEFFDSRGIVVHFADEGGVSLSTNTAKGKLVTTMLLAVAEYEPGETAERTSKGMKHRQANGQRMTSAKTIPFGQMIDPKDPARTIPCQAEIHAIDQAKWLHEKGISLRDIAQHLGLVRGKILSPQSVKSLLSKAQP